MRKTLVIRRNNGLYLAAALQGQKPTGYLRFTHGRWFTLGCRYPLDK